MNSDSSHFNHLIDGHHDKSDPKGQTVALPANSDNTQQATRVIQLNNSNRRNSQRRQQQQAAVELEKTSSQTFNKDPPTANQLNEKLTSSDRSTINLNKLSRNISYQEILATTERATPRDLVAVESNQQPRLNHKPPASRRVEEASSSSKQQQQQKLTNCSCMLSSNENNQFNTHIDNGSNSSFLFWKFLSNLSRSIAQRTKSETSNSGILAPEVEGYLANKWPCKKHCEESADGHVLHGVSKLAPPPPPPVSVEVKCNDDADETPNSSHNTMKADNSSKPTAGGQEKMAQRVRVRQVSLDGQRLIKIIAPSTQADDDDDQVPPTLGSTQVDEPQAAYLAGSAAAADQLSSSKQQPPFLKPQSSPAQGPTAALSAAGQQIKHSLATTITNTTATTTTTRSSASSLSSCILSNSSTSEVRLRWGKKMDFLLSIIGFAVDLANIWRFPYLVYKNGGGVFLIPYVTMLIFGGIPLFFLELCLGQFVKKGPITVWDKICPSMKGVGYCSLLISWYVSFYYNVLIAWSVYFIYRSLLSFGDKMPWEDCDNSWNSKHCVSISQLKSLCSTRNDSLEVCRKDAFAVVNVTSPASEFFVKELSQIDQSSGLDDMGYLRPELVLCTVVVYLLHYFSLFRGLETSGKVVWVTATAPYMILSILLVRGLFLPGASMGIEYYLSPKLEKLADPQVWIDAAGQVFYSIGVGFGVHLTYASFNSHNNNCYRDCLMTSAVNAATSVYSGLVVFVYLGYMAKNLGIEIDKVANEGYSLVFEVYPEALTTLPFARFWSILFFIMLLTLGIDSAMGGLEAVITGLEDEFRFAKRLSRGQLTGLVIVSSFLPALISCTQGGAYTLFWFDIYSAGVSLLFSALFETIGVVYCYGLKRFILDIESMIGRKPNLFYILCWRYISPILLGGVIFMSIYTASVPTYRGYTFPLWSIILGWCLAFSSVSAVPIVAIWRWHTQRGKAGMNNERSIRKRNSRGSSSLASSKKSPNHKSVSASCTGQAQGGLTMTTTTLISTSPDHQHHIYPPSTGGHAICRTGEEMV